MNYSSTYTQQHSNPTDRSFFVHHNGTRTEVEIEEIQPGQIFSIVANTPGDELYGKEIMLRCTGPVMVVLGRPAIPCEKI